MGKDFRLTASDMKPLARGRGGCIATDRITVDGAKVGYMYREAPSYPDDSGWAFFAGDESQEYVDEPSNSEVYDVNTIANYDPDIIRFLDAPVGSRFARFTPGGPLVPDSE